jgi:hypothetical protein
LKNIHPWKGFYRREPEYLEKTCDVW